VTSPPAPRQAEKTRMFFQEQLVAEVKAIHARLAMVESKCIEVDKTLRPQHKPGGNPPPLDNMQYQALLALHRALFHEHHDFFLAPQHPLAYPSLRRVTAKSIMPAGMAIGMDVRGRLSCYFAIPARPTAVQHRLPVSIGPPFFRHDRARSLRDSKRRRYGLLPRPCLWLFIANTIDMLDVAGWQSKPATTRRGVGRAGREPQAERQNAVPTTT
jgi:hypothetical protein